MHLLHVPKAPDQNLPEQRRGRVSGSWGPGHRGFCPGSDGASGGIWGQEMSWMKSESEG